jgi:FAD dependent oxidoreductase
MPGTKGGLWTYRRLIDSAQFGAKYPTELSIFNWPGNDYRESSIIDRPAVAAALQDAKRASLGFLHWVQTKAPAEGDRLGAPELSLQPDIMGTTDGVAKFPYIREARRIKALRSIVEQDVSAHFQNGPTAAHFEDSVGVGWYPIDIHRAGPEDVGISCRTRPFQIPLGALIPVRLRNLIAAAKNIGTTHITNGCYRLAPRRMEHWRSGRRAGGLLPRPGRDPSHRPRKPRAMRGFPARLGRRGRAAGLGRSFARMIRTISGTRAKTGRSG